MSPITSQPSTPFLKIWLTKTWQRLVIASYMVVIASQRRQSSNDSVEAQIDGLSPLAPLHNPVSLMGIRAARDAFPEVPNVAVFDTAFHSTLSPASASYALNAEVAHRFGIRRFGFHGISYQHVSSRAAELLDKPLSEVKLIAFHLGNGASACAISGGRSVETSMGMTPLEGLVMGSRAGDIDPGVVLHLMRKGFPLGALDRLLTQQSGLIGLAGSEDMRDVQSAAAAGDAGAQTALDIYQHRLRHYLGAYLAQLGGADAIVFTAGVGENSPHTRAGALAGLEGLGIQIDPELNAASGNHAREISSAQSRISVIIIPTNEELEIARQTIEALN